MVIAEQLTGEPKDPVFIPFSETIGKEYGSVHFPSYPDNMANIPPEGPCYHAVGWMMMVMVLKMYTKEDKGCRTVFFNSE
jgi:hypothetical protein